MNLIAFIAHKGLDAHITEAPAAIGEIAEAISQCEALGHH
jgi:hypothetical protein